MTDPDRRARIDRLFDDALEQPAGERSAWLAAACAGDSSLQAEVEALLTAHARAGILEAPVRTVRDAVEPPAERRIGPYRVVRELGRGGMGVVYLAERDDGEYQRRVAVKLLRGSPDADELQRRFRAERQILASLDHPNIAQLLDGGVTDGELPYLIMEYVEGLPITVYCDRHRLTVDERLRLFLDVCSAVRHAHQNLVVHRDLKPGNILVTADGRVKLLDFGIAKLLNPSIAGVPQPVTRTEFRVMTPEYASPEQVRGEPLSTASDVYALGVVLYELLAGRRPYRLTSTSPAELAEVVCEREPERPSSGATPERLRRELQGDVDAIVMMALRKEPRQRYGTVERLARDIERYLDGRPVLAHRGSRSYRLRRFVARHRRGVATAAVVLLALIAGTAVALWQAAAARAERDRAAAALAESEEVTGFLVGLFEESDPYERGGAGLTVRDLLRRATAQAESLGSQPAVRARMLEVMGHVYRNLAEHETSRVLLERALALREAGGDSTDPHIANTLAELAETLTRQRRFAAAESATRRALALRRLDASGTEPGVAELMLQLSGIRVYAADIAGADSIAREAVALRRRELDSDDPRLAHALERYASTRRRLGLVAETEQLLREALAIYDRGERGSPWPSYVRLRLADLLWQDRGAYAEADSLYRHALANLQMVLGPDHPRTIYASNDYAGFLRRRGGADEAETIYRANLDRLRRIFGAEHPATAAQLALVGAAAHAGGRYREAEQLMREALDGFERTRGRESNEFTGTLGSLGRTLLAMNRVAEADSVMRLSVAIRTEQIGESDTPLLAIALAGLAGTATARGAYAEADSLYQESIRILELHTSDQHIDVRRVRAGQARLHAAWNRPDAAAEYRRLAGRDVVPY